MTFSLTHLRGPLGVANARREWMERESVVVTLRQGERVGHGECAPLPGYSPDSLAECMEALEVWGLHWVERWQELRDNAFPSVADLISDDPDRSMVQTDAEEATSMLPPAAAFAAESALLQLAGYAAPTCQSPLSLAHLLSGEGTEEGAKAAAFKLKVGRDLAAECALLETLARKHPGASVRLDANQSLSLADAPSALHRLAAASQGLDLEFVEEPVQTAELLQLLHGPAPLPVPLALDESLQHAEESMVDAVFSQAQAKGHLGALVLKPMALGPRWARQLALRAVQARIPRVVSHVFGGPLAYAQTARFAFEIAEYTQMDKLPQSLGRHPGLDAFEGWSTPLGKRGMLCPWQANNWPIDAVGIPS